MNTSSSQQGAIFLPLAIIIFIISLSAAGWITWRLWQNSFQFPLVQKITTTAPTPSQETDLLSSELTLDSALENQRPELTKKLLIPMRQYYATRSERLGTVSVKKLDDSEHSTQVTLNLAKDSGPQDLKFYYDKDKKDTYPTWDPGLLENSN